MMTPKTLAKCCSEGLRKKDAGEKRDEMIRKTKKGTDK
jgi:hypothetical protein